MRQKEAARSCTGHAVKPRRTVCAVPLGLWDSKEKYSLSLQAGPSLGALSNVGLCVASLFSPRLSLNIRQPHARSPKSSRACQVLASPSVPRWVWRAVSVPASASA